MQDLVGYSHLNELYSSVRRERVWVLSHFGVKYGMDFDLLGSVQNRV